MFDCRIPTPSTIGIAGPTSSGKTTVAMQLVKWKHEMFNPVPTHTVWMYSERSSIPKELIEENLIDQCFHGGISYEELRDVVMKYKENGGSTLVIFDDSLSYFNNDFSKVFYELSHHG